MILALIAFSVLALLAAMGLLACAPRYEPTRYILPAVRATAVLSVAAVYIAALWSH